MLKADDERWQVEDLTIDVGGQTVYRDGSPIILPQLSFKFLMALVRSAPRLLSIDELMEQVWAGVFVNPETVTQRAKLLRDALHDNPKGPHYFSVRRGAGYQLIPTPVRLDGETEGAGAGIAPFGNGRRGLSRHRKPMLLGAIMFGILSLGGVTAVVTRPGNLVASQQSNLRVAVLPFDNLSSDPSDAFIARSIPEMVLNRLSSIRGLTVIARDSALIGPASNLRANEAGRKLRAGFIVKGSVQRIGETLRVTCFVVDTAQGVRLWSERFDWPVDRLYALQDRIAERVATSLETKVRGLGPLPQMASASRNSDAYLAFLKGKSLLSRLTVAETDAAAAQFERATRLDPDFGDALIALFDARMQGADLRKDDLSPFRARYQPLLDKALKRHPDSGPGLFAKAMWSDVPASERESLFRRAAELDPSNSRGLTAYAEFLDWNALKQGREYGPQAKLLVDRVLAIDPLSARAQFWAVQRQLNKLTPDQMEQAQLRALELDPANYPLANRYAARRWMFHGQTAEAIDRMERVIASDPQNPWGPHVAVALYLDANDPAAARAMAATTPASRDSTRALLAQYSGDWRGAGQAALGRRGFLFNPYSNWKWAETVRDYALRTGEYQRGAEAIASRYGFDLRNPRTLNLPQSVAAPALGNILLAAGRQEAGTRLLAGTVQWIDAHPSYGLVGLGHTRATAMMLLGIRGQALSDLRASIETGHDIRHWWYIIDRDPVWAPVRGDPRFKAIAEFCRQAARVQREKLDALRRAGRVPDRPPRTGA